MLLRERESSVAQGALDGRIAESVMLHVWMKSGRMSRQRSAGHGEALTHITRVLDSTSMIGRSENAHPGGSAQAGRTGRERPLVRASPKLIGCRCSLMEGDSLSLSPKTTSGAGLICILETWAVRGTPNRAVPNF